LPIRTQRGDGPPVPRAWAERDVVAARRLQLCRVAMAALAEEHGMPVENLLTPDTLRRVLWTPPSSREPGELLEAVVDQLTGYGARGWQIALAAPLVVQAILDADAYSEGDDPEGALPPEASESSEPSGSSGS
jgi:ribonuclease D